MLIRRADVRDYIRLKKIRDLFVLTPELLGKLKSADDFSNDGFLLGEYLEDEYTNDLSKIFLIAESDSSLLGYIRIDNVIDPDFKKFDLHGDINWTDSDFKNKFYKTPHFELGAILVDSNERGKGVGKVLLDYSLGAILSEIPKMQKETTLFSFIMVEPIENKASVRFHQKNGFIKVAELKPCELYGFKGYKSVLLAKTIGKSKNWD
jgi:GNAT superfamily N-acetyltransferase